MDEISHLLETFPELMSWDLEKYPQSPNALRQYDVLRKILGREFKGSGAWPGMSNNRNR